MPIKKLPLLTNVHPDSPEMFQLVFGVIVERLAIRPIRTAATGPLCGTSETSIAAEAAIRASAIPRWPFRPMMIGNAAFPTSNVTGDGECGTLSGPLTRAARSWTAM